jgi:hypothetical protein
VSRQLTSSVQIRRQDAQTTHTQQPPGLSITMKVSEHSRSDLSLKDIYDDIILRFDSTQRSQASLHQILSFLVQEVHDLKRGQREGGS